MRLLQQRSRLAAIQRQREQESLGEAESEGAQLIELFGRFHPFGDCIDGHAAAERDDGLHDLAAFATGVQLVDEGAVIFSMEIFMSRSWRSDVRPVPKSSMQIWMPRARSLRTSSTVTCESRIMIASVRSRRRHFGLS